MSDFKRIARFEIVSFEQFKSGFDNKTEEEIKEIYDKLKLPKRATKGSAGYDFFAPFKITLKPGETIKVPTGIRCYMEPNWVLKLYPRSGLGFKYRLQLNNTVGIIDSDYYYSDNEGHIFAKITNDSNEGKILEIEALTGFMQGIFVEYGITFEDDATEVRNGGFGSTTKK
jgi:dUTP pyrophosphatase